jgi:uncharacterized protein DUF6894
MPRYFFQARYHGMTVVDDIGEEFSTEQEAQAHAAIVARELSPPHDAQEVTVTVLREGEIHTLNRTKL